MNTYPIPDEAVTIRLSVARHLDDDNPRCCWADLALWAMGYKEDEDDESLLEILDNDECYRTYSAQPCWCNKQGADDGR